MHRANRNHAARAALLLAVVSIAVALFGIPGSKRIGLCRVHLSNPQALATLQRTGFDIVEIEPQCFGVDEAHADVLVTKRNYQHLRDLGLDVEWVTRDFIAQQGKQLKSAALAPQSSAPPGFGGGAMGGYYTYSEIVALLDHYAQSYPSIVAPKIAIGTSLEGRPLFALKLSDNPNSTEAEPSIVLDALQHAREPTSMQTVVYLLHQLVTAYGSDPTLTKLVDSREIWFVPCVNPDGYVFNESNSPNGGGLWRKNRHPSASCFGVDLNRNYPFQWGVDDLGSSNDPCSEAYRGQNALSEPESSALEAFAAAQHTAMTISLHAHGRLMIHPFGHLLVAPENDGIYDAHGEVLAAENDYAHGTIADTVGLANGNYVDHCHATLGAEAWAFEIGTAFWPSLAEMSQSAQTNAKALIDLIGLAGSDVRAQALEVGEIVGRGDGFPDPGETVEVRVQVRNLGRQTTASGIGVEITSTAPGITVLMNQASGSTLAAQASELLGSGQLRLALATTLAVGSTIQLAVTTTFDGRSTEATLAFALGKPRRIGVDAAEQDLGWRLGIPSDQSFTGKWVRADPKLVMQGLEVAQPEEDASPTGTYAFVTGNGGTAPGQDDVDDGETTLISPRFDLSAAVEPRLRYSRFYWCSKANHALRIDLSNDDGVTFVNVETVNGRPNDWRSSEVRVADIVAPSANMRLRVIAEDDENSAVVEAVLDEFEINDFGTRPHVLVMGRPRSSGLVEVQIAGTPQKSAWLFVSPLPGNQAVVGLDGPFLLDVQAAVFAGTITLPSDGLARIPAIVPSNPAFVGIETWVQAIVLDAMPRASNVASVKIEAP